MNITIKNVSSCNHSTERDWAGLTEIWSSYASLYAFNQNKKLHSLRCGCQRPKHSCYHKTTNNKDDALLIGAYLLSLLALYTLITTRSSVAVNACHTVAERWLTWLCFSCKLFILHVRKQRHVHSQRSLLKQVLTWEYGPNVSAEHSSTKHHNIILWCGKINDKWPITVKLTIFQWQHVLFFVFYTTVICQQVQFVFIKEQQIVLVEHP